jgi:hypothetical protein
VSNVVNIVVPDDPGFAIMFRVSRVSRERNPAVSFCRCSVFSCAEFCRHGKGSAGSRVFVARTASKRSESLEDE